MNKAKLSKDQVGKLRNRLSSKLAAVSDEDIQAFFYDKPDADIDNLDNQQMGALAEHLMTLGE